MRGIYKKLIFIIGGVIILIIGLIVAGLFIWKAQINEAKLQTSTQEKSYVEKTKKLNDTPSVANSQEFEKIVDNYSEDYALARAAVFSKPPKEWTADVVDKAYFLLAYQVKVEEYQSVGIILDKLDAAKAAGIAIDRPGADQAYRDSLRNVFKDAMSQPDLRPSNARRE